MPRLSDRDAPPRLLEKVRSYRTQDKPHSCSWRYASPKMPLWEGRERGRVGVLRRLRERVSGGRAGLFPKCCNFFPEAGKKSRGRGRKCL